MNVIEFKNVNYQRKSKDSEDSICLTNVNFVIKKGEFVFLKGKSGTGKTTIIDLIEGIKQPDSGEIKVFGRIPDELPVKFITGVLLPDGSFSFKNTPLKRINDFVESHYPKNMGKIASILDKLDLKNSTNKDNKVLSQGERKRFYLGIAQAGEPELLILDEATEKLDKDDSEEDSRRKLLKNQLDQDMIQQGKTVLFVCHDSDAETFFKPTRIFLLEKSEGEYITRFKEIKESEEQLKTKDSDLSKIKETRENEQLLPETKDLEVSLVKEEKITEKLLDETIESKLNYVKELGISHWISLLFQHIKFNILQTFKAEPKYFWYILVYSCLWAIFFSLASNTGEGGDFSNLYTITVAYSFYLSLSATKNTGNAITDDLQDSIWKRLLKILPLPPIIYLSGKVISSLFVNFLLSLGMLGTTLICNLIFSSISHLESMGLAWQTIPSVSLGLSLGTIPFLCLGLGFGYLCEKSNIVEGVAFIFSFIITFPLFSRPILEIIGNILKVEEEKLGLATLIADNIAAHSPMYHYIQLILYFGKAPEYDQHLLLHFGWLIWFTFISLLFALWTYQRTAQKEAKL
jgi:ABC-2 type transport system ATP-binding protein